MVVDERTLAGRVALVTGASGGIGAAICRRFARAGATVAVGYGANRGAAEELCAELEAGGARARSFGADMADPEGPGRLVEEVRAAVGAADVLVANHGRGRKAEIDALTAQEFDLTLAINLRAPFLLAQGVLPAMRERGFGRIVFISSTAALRGGSLAPDYSASKSGLHGLAHFLAARVARDGVTVNVVAPGYVETAMLPGDPAELGRLVPVGRVGRPEEVADLVHAAATNGYITSHVLSVDGGIHPY
ncbi:MAG: SDR family NAD(P)-dependent oxidoreductase [Solirubrobacteraceae bacterium]